jgi:Flp pilus assembly protein protease CpaA
VIGIDDVDLFCYGIPRIFAIIILFVCSVIDYKTRRVPNKLTFPLIAIGIILSIIIDSSSFFLSCCASLIFLLMGFLPCIGMGDIKLLVGLSWYFNPYLVMISLAVASILVVAHRLILYPHLTFYQILTRGLKPVKLQDIEEKNASNSVAFAPYLLFAFFLVQGGDIIWTMFLA